jgi:flagellar assembly factor FliW
MVILNNKFEQKSSTTKTDQTESVLDIDSPISGITTLLAQIPTKTEGSLPIKLISNLNSNFLLAVTNSYNFRSEFKFNVLQQQFLIFYHKIQRKKMISYLITARSKDIQ